MEATESEQKIYRRKSAEGENRKKSKGNQWMFK